MTQAYPDSKSGILQPQRMPQLAVPPLLEGDRIEDWEPAFKAAVAPCLLADGGEKFVVGLLPAYVNRRPAEVELVRELISAGAGLEASFKSLKSLDPPVDKYESMQKLCRMNWLPGVQVDDFFYALKKMAKQAEAKLDFVCSILCAQLPKEVQGKTKSWLADNTVTEENARDLLVKVKTWMMERGIPLDNGFRSLESYGEPMNVKVMSCTTPGEPGTGAVPPQRVGDREKLCGAPASATQLGEDGVARVAYTGNKKQPPPRRQTSSGFRGKCYVCGGNHMMKSCPDKRCPRCGAKGHSLMNCNTSKVSSVQQSTEAAGSAACESAVLLSVKLGGQCASALIDSGAGPSVIDKGTLLNLGLLRKIKRQNHGHVLGVGNIEIPVFGHAELDVELEGGLSFAHTFTVLDSYDDIVLLGRSFCQGSHQ